MLSSLISRVMNRRAGEQSRTRNPKSAWNLESLEGRELMAAGGMHLGTFAQFARARALSAHVHRMAATRAPFRVTAPISIGTGAVTAFPAPTLPSGQTPAGYGGLRSFPSGPLSPKSHIAFAPVSSTQAAASTPVVAPTLPSGQTPAGYDGLNSYPSGPLTPRSHIAF